MKNHRQLVIDAMKKAGFEYVRPVKHGEMYRKGNKVRVIPQRVDTLKIARLEIRRAER